MKRLLTYLRSIVTEKRLNNCVLLHVYKDLTDQLDITVIAKEFISAITMIIIDILVHILLNFFVTISLYNIVYKHSKNNIIITIIILNPSILWARYRYYVILSSA